MLTLKKLNHRATSACITVAPDMSVEDKARLALLAGILKGRHTNNPEAYHFTGARGAKCWLLFQAGFSAVPKLRYHWNDRAFVHPATNHLHLSSAVAMARTIMKVKEGV